MDLQLGVPCGRPRSSTRPARLCFTKHSYKDCAKEEIEVPMATTAQETFTTEDRIVVAFLYCNNHEATDIRWNPDDNQCEWTFVLTEDLEDCVNDFALNEARVEPKRFFSKFNKVRNEQFNLSRAWRGQR